MLANKITEKNIEAFVILFYTNIIKDKEVGPFFTDILGEDINNNTWQDHIELLCDFWCSMTLEHNSYRGSPFAPHATMTGLKKETFVRWLEILDETLDNIYEKETSEIFRQTGAIMSKNFMRNLGL